MRKLFVLFIGLYFFSQTLSEIANQKSDSIYVDFLTDNYLLTEIDIWNDISSKANLKDVIQKIHSEHLNLFWNPLFTSEQSDNRLSFNGKNFFDESVADVKSKIKVVRDNYLHDSTDPESLKKQILDMAMINSNTTLIDSIYDSVVKEDFFGYIKMVICFFTQ